MYIVDIIMINPIPEQFGLKNMYMSSVSVVCFTQRTI